MKNTDQSTTQRIGDLRVDVDSQIAVVTMDRPDKLNAITRRFYGDLISALRLLEGQSEVRVVVITGAGDKAFSAGGDINSFRDLNSLSDRRRYQLEAMEAFEYVERCSLPIIAAVNGWALGGGCELTMACDMVIASENARFGMPEAALGLVPGYGILRAPDIIGRQMTKMIIAAKLKLPAERALQIGLVQQVVPHDELMPTVMALAKEVASSSPLALDVGKRVINRGIDRAEFDHALEALTVLQASEDTAEGTLAFLEKRSPVFKDREVS